MQATARQTDPRAPLLSALLDAALITDPLMTINAWNRGAEQLFGFAAADAIGSNVRELLTAPTSRSTIHDLTSRITHDGNWSGILSLRRRDRTNLLAHLTATAVRHPDGTPDAILLVAHPVDGDERPRHELPALGDPTRDIELDRRARQAFVAGRAVDLTATEFDLLDLLVTNDGRVLSIEEIAAAIWGHGTHGSANFVQAAVSRLRRKLRAAGRRHLIETVRGHGYTARLR